MPVCTVNDAQIFYEDIGLGEPVLFLHSSYSRGILAFGGQIQPFSQSYRCLFPDFRGHGRTRSGNLDWSTPQIAEDMAGFLRELDIRRAHLIGYSLGGGVALHLAAKYPELVHSIATIGCGGVADPEGADEYEPEALIKAVRTDIINRMTALHAEASGGDWQRHMRQSARDWRLYPCLAEGDWAKLKMPMLLIAGELDQFATQERLLAMQARCPQAQMWVVPGGSHRPHMPMEQVRDVNLRMLSFLQSVPQ